jgi:hypothetical protein
MDPNFFTVNDFTYGEAQNTLSCPAGKMVPLFRKAVYHYRDQKRKGMVSEFSPQQCHHCELMSVKKNKIPAFKILNHIDSWLTN